MGYFTGKFRGLGFWSMMIFLGVLTIGFIYEWKKGSFRLGIKFNLNSEKLKANPGRVQRFGKRFC